MKLNICVQIIGKSPYIKFHKNPSNGIRIFPCGQTYRQTWRK